MDLEIVQAICTTVKWTAFCFSVASVFWALFYAIAVDCKNKKQGE